MQAAGRATHRIHPCLPLSDDDESLASCSQESMMEQSQSSQESDARSFPIDLAAYALQDEQRDACTSLFYHCIRTLYATLILAERVPNVYFDPHNSSDRWLKYLTEIQLLKEWTVYENGCGTLKDTLGFVKLGANVIASDEDEHVLSVACKRLKENGAESRVHLYLVRMPRQLVESGAMTWESADIVHLSCVAPYRPLGQLEEFMREHVGVLKQDGFLVVDFFLKEHFQAEKNAESMSFLSPEEVVNLLNSLSLKILYKNIVWGHRQISDGSIQLWNGMEVIAQKI